VVDRARWNWPTTATVPPINAKALGQKVLAIIDSGNAAIQADKQKSPNRVAFTDVSAVFASTAQQLQSLTYPADAQADAKAVVAILETLSGDTSQLAQATSVVEQDAILGNITNDETTDEADSDALRHDLGLPPASSAP